MLTEDLSAMPVHREIRDALRRLIAAGHDPSEVAEAAVVVGTGLAVSIEGPIRAGAQLYAAGAALMSANAQAA